MVGKTWFPWVLKSFDAMCDKHALESFGVTTDGPREAITELDEWHIEEKGKLKTFFTLLTELAAARCWSQVQFSILIPNTLAGVLSEHDGRARGSLSATREVWNAILKAEEFTKVRGQVALKNLVGARLTDLCWNRLQIARESYLVCQKDQWRHTGPNIRELALAMFSGPATTKFDLEDGFAHLSSVAKTTTQATPMNKRLGVSFFINMSIWRFTRWVRWWYLTTMPSLRESGWNQVATSLEGHAKEIQEGNRGRQEFDAGKNFKVTDPLPKPIRAAIIQCKLDNVKKAGSQSNQRASAATALLLQSARQDFKPLAMAWTGSVVENCADSL